MSRSWRVPGANLEAGQLSKSIPGEGKEDRTPPSPECFLLKLFPILASEDLFYQAQPFLHLCSHIYEPMCMQTEVSTCLMYVWAMWGNLSLQRSMFTYSFPWQVPLVPGGLVWPCGGQVNDPFVPVSWSLSCTPHPEQERSSN